MNAFRIYLIAADAQDTKSVEEIVELSAQATRADYQEFRRFIRDGAAALRYNRGLTPSYEYQTVGAY